MEKRNIRTISYEEYNRLYTHYIDRRYDIGKTLFKIFQKADDVEGVLPKDLTRVDKSSESSYSKILERQDASEKKFGRQDRLRYYQRSDTVHTRIKRGNSAIETILKKPLLRKREKNFNKLSDSEKEKLILEIEREEVVLSALELNISNRMKNDHSQYENGHNAYIQKNNKIADYIAKVIEYNSKVDENDQIPFGFTFKENTFSDAKTALIANVPGYTRVSVHFGLAVNLAEVISRVRNHKYSNDKARKMAEKLPLVDKETYNLFRSARNDPSYKEKKTYAEYYKKSTEYQRSVFESCKYQFKRFDKAPIGILNDVTGEEEKKDREILLGILKKPDSEINDIKDFIYFIKPDLNDREVIYLAEKADVRLNNYKNIEKVLGYRRSDMQQTHLNPVKYPNDVKEWQKKYIERTLSRMQENRKQDRLGRLFENYLEANKDKTILDAIKEFDEGVPNQYRKLANRIYGKELGDRIMSGDDRKFDFYESFIEPDDEKGEKFNLNKFIDAIAILGNRKTERTELTKKAMILVPEITQIKEKELAEEIKSHIDKRIYKGNEYIDTLEQISDIASKVTAEGRREAEREEKILRELKNIK